MKITNLDQLLEDELKDIYSAENQLLKALPNMVQAAESRDLRTSFEKHLEQTQTHLRRIEEICRDLKIEPSGKTCAGMGGLIKEGEEVIQSDMGSEPKQAALIGAVRGTPRSPPRRRMPNNLVM
jgi:ferritin-like metal-binding protein YciE